MGTPKWFFEGFVVIDLEVHPEYNSSTPSFLVDCGEDNSRITASSIKQVRGRAKQTASVHYEPKRL